MENQNYSVILEFLPLTFSPPHVTTFVAPLFQEVFRDI
jgi:hypothetical protein